MSDGILTKDTTLSYAATSGGNYTQIPDLQEVPDFAADVDRVEITTLANSARRYKKGIKDYGELEFVFLYDNSGANSNYRILKGLEDADTNAFWKVEFPDGTTLAFQGEVAVGINGAGVGDVFQLTATISLSSDITVTNPSA